MLKEFKAFAMKGNLIDIAVGLILALAFSAVVTAFVDGVLMNLIAALWGSRASTASWTIGDAPDPTEIRVGAFLTALVNFVIVAVGALPDREGGEPVQEGRTGRRPRARSSC